MSSDLKKKFQEHQRGVDPTVLKPEKLAGIVKGIEEKANVEIAMVLINADNTPMTAHDFLETVESDENLHKNLTNDGTKSILPLQIFMKCKCVHVLTEKGWPRVSQVCPHGNFFVKMN